MNWSAARPVTPPAELRPVAGQEPARKGWKQKPVLLYCRSGRRAGVALQKLEQAGFTRLEHLSGDMDGWQKEGRPLAR